MNITRTIFPLGKLSKEQKEQTWSSSVSGSQAWMLINEPYNLIRDKLNIPRIFPSKYDFFNTEKGKEIGANAMSAGTLYESTVFQEVLQHIPNAVSEDICYQTKLTIDGVEKEWRITATPDWVVWNENKTIALQFGDIKCSTSADDMSAMTERYYYQLLHNGYVLNCLTTELDTKNSITRPLNRYSFELTQQDLVDYQNKLIEFFTALENKDASHYDYLYEQQQQQTNQTTTPMETRQVEKVDKEFDFITKLWELKQQQAAIKEEIDNIESYFKDSYDNMTLCCGDNSLIVKTTNIKGSIDYPRLLKDLATQYNIDTKVAEQYRKAGYLKKSITFK